MPLLKRKPFSLLEPPSDLQPRELVFQIRFTKEIFRDYQEYLKRINLYRQRIWTCKVTGKSNFTYEEALVSEQRASEKVQQFPEEFIVPTLRTIQYSMLPLSDLVRKIKAELQESLVEGAKLQGKKDGCVHSCKIIKVFDEEAGKGRYEVAWLDNDDKISGTAVVGEEDFVRKKLPFGREVLKSYIRESTYRSLPWVIHNNLASKYGIPTDTPEELKGKISFLNGCVIKNKKRKTSKEPQEGNAGKHKKSKIQTENGLLRDNDLENGDESIKYPIDDQLVEPGADDPIFTDRPTPSRDFTIQMDSVGDLLLVWDFCSSFSRLLYLWPFSFEDFEKAICHKDSNLTLVVETHASLLRLLMNDEGLYYIVIQRKKRKPKITLITWTEYLCDFLEMIDISELSTHIPTIKRGHYGLLEPPIKLRILKELVDQAIATDLVRAKIDERLEERQTLAASKRGEALEEGKKKREAKERLKAVSEANGIVLEQNSGTVEEVSCVAGSNGAGLENGHVAELSSEQKDVSQNGESGHKNSGLREKTKKLLEDLEKSKDERKDFLEKEMEKRVIRTNSLGKDRDYNRYWFFRRDGRVFVESSDSKQWGYYCCKEELDALMGSLNPKGERERALKKQLDKYYSRISKELQKRSKDIARRTAIEDAILRRSTRVRAPPKDNPSLAFLQYSNKWKVLMG
ncbi:DDT domain-containing protein DDB_G0282237-like isoform X1 [Chenopodium quinoa]|uniref:DDT domain-containing protein DDB_G0282237-like isoform X1 n=2 Tax=Chenopodium quinoa TaxID=63459 RepID=UPI000B781ADC|nr:DDT domain-containing protein DDB_G0282237-like isoform X1 [Chenopodium quinoa]XP_021733314.1 DDT domain-containing protein DDB_G0282237-like isoform X1 [Chenopodium quinoa]